MKRSNRLVIFVGVLLAILAFIGIIIVLNQKPSPTGPGGTTGKVTVLVAGQDIKIGDPVTPDKVSEQQVDPSGVKGTPFGSKSAVSGQPALVNIPKGSQVSQEDVPNSATGIKCVSCQLKPGERAIAFQVDRVTGIDFLIQQGDHVDVVLSEKVAVLQPTTDSVGKPASQQRFETVPGLDAVRTVKTILQNKRVLYVSQTRIQTAQAPAASATPAPGSQTTTPATIENVIVVIAGTDQDAEAIKFAQNDVTEVGSLTAILRSTGDTAEPKTLGITLDKLVTQYGLAVPSIIKPTK